MNCYICGATSTSDEHAPARSFFPIGKRNQLITVRSCAEHNEDTSKDDEYVRNVIVMSLGNNGAALEHFLNKGLSSFKRSPALLTQTTGVRKTVHIKEESNDALTPTFAFKIERERIDFVLRKISYALFFFKYRTPWDKELNVATEFLLTEDQPTNTLLEDLIQEAKTMDHLLSYEGENPDVFQYVFIETSGNIHDQILRLKFYEGFEAWILPVPNTTGPVLEKSLNA